MTAAPVAVRRPAVAVPPWALLWLAVFALAVPGLVRDWWARYVELTAAGSWGPELAATTSFAILRALTTLGLLPAAVITVGLLAVAVPPLRAAVVERRLRLTAPPRPVLAEIEEFLRAHGATVEVRANLARQDRLARVYPAGGRRARLAVFGPLVALWRRDREAAEAVLLHEVAHVRTGDHLVLGLGSPFLALIRLWVLAWLAAVPLAAWAVAVQPAGAMMIAQVLVLLGAVPRLVLLPVGALWLAEFAADRYVVEAGRRDGLLRALALQGGHGGHANRWRRASTLLSHPPVALRCRAVDAGPARTAALLASWPLLVLAQLTVIVAFAVPAYRLTGMSGADVATVVLAHSGGYLLDSQQIWGPAVLLLLAWPAVARAWTRWWSGIPVDRGDAPAWPALAAAGAVAAVLGTTLLLST